MDATYTYTAQDGIFEIRSRDGGLAATFEQCYPFDQGKMRLAYRTTVPEYHAAIENLFGRTRGGYDPSDEEHASLRRALLTLVVVGEDECAYVPANSANLLTFGRYPSMKITAEEFPSSQRLAWIRPGRTESAVLFGLMTLRIAGLTLISESTAFPLSAVYRSLQHLKEMGYVVMRADKKYALTQSGFYLTCEMARLSPMVPECVPAGMGWESAKEALIGIHGFEKDFFFLSNFFAAPVVYDGIQYLNSEAAYQSWRCAEREDRKRFSALFAADAKKMGHHGVETRTDWDNDKLAVMRGVLRAKFTQNPDLAEALANTYGELVETNTWSDNFYGNCVCPDCFDIFGQNKLGELLAEERRYWRRALRTQPCVRASTEHDWHLLQEPFQMMLQGEKDIELRLLDEKRKRLQIGDTIRFLGQGHEQFILAEVQSFIVYPDFEMLFSEVGPKRCGLSEGKSPYEHVSDMSRYYSPEALERHNALAIVVNVVDSGRCTPDEEGDER